MFKTTHSEEKVELPFPAPQAQKGTQPEPGQGVTAEGPAGAQQPSLHGPLLQSSHPGQKKKKKNTKNTQTLKVVFAPAFQITASSSVAAGRSGLYSGCPGGRWALRATRASSTSAPALGPGDSGCTTSHCAAGVTGQRLQRRGRTSPANTGESQRRASRSTGV